MKLRDLLELLFLAAIWGGSFLFMRLAAPEFGAVTMAGLRVAGAALVLLPLLAHRQGLSELRANAGPLLVAGFFNCALPFILFSYAALSITAGLSSILNATTPMWGALVAWVWLSQRLSGLRILGLVIGFGGVAFLAWDKASFKDGGSGLALLACLAAALCYGIGANYVKRRLPQVGSLTVATGNVLGAALLLALPATLLAPAQMPG
ncbi:MAG TPA: DMT family transporter, partial [Burkholderiaceae bacterium]